MSEYIMDKLAPNRCTECDGYSWSPNGPTMYDHQICPRCHCTGVEPTEEQPELQIIFG